MYSLAFSVQLFLLRRYQQRKPCQQNTRKRKKKWMAKEQKGGRKKDIQPPRAYFFSAPFFRRRRLLWCMLLTLYRASSSPPELKYMRPTIIQQNKNMFGYKLKHPSNFVGGRSENFYYFICTARQKVHFSHILIIILLVLSLPRIIVCLHLMGWKEGMIPSLMWTE